MRRADTIYQGVYRYVTGSLERLPKAIRQRLDLDYIFKAIPRRSDPEASPISPGGAGVSKPGLGQRCGALFGTHRIGELDLGKLARHASKILGQNGSDTSPKTFGRLLQGLRKRPVRATEIKDGEDDEHDLFLLAGDPHQFSLEGLNTDRDLERLTRIVGRFAERSCSKGTDNVPYSFGNLNLLLSGPPGTGKTEFVRHLARTLDRGIIVHTASRLLGRYSGETEARIAAAFAEAEQKRRILFIDEADSFLWGRETATTSWQVSQVNEFLCRMDQFRGILVCATNFMDRFDRAAVRRFSIKVRFDWLTPEGKQTFWDRMLAPLLDKSSGLSETERDRLAKIPSLSPGDFRVVRQTFELEDHSIVTAEMLLDALEAEVRYKSCTMAPERRIGFLS